MSFSLTPIAASGSTESQAPPFDVVSLYYNERFSVDEDEFSELCAHCVLPLSYVVSNRIGEINVDQHVILDRNAYSRFFFLLARFF